MHYSEKEGREQLKNNMEILKERGIVSFDVGFTPEEQESIREIIIQKELPQFNHYGPIDHELLENLIAHLSQLEGNRKESIITLSRFIARIAEDVRKKLHQEAAWVMVRVTLPDDTFDLPRWHVDGKYFSSEEKTYKLVFAVKGPPSRFAEIKDKEKFQQLSREIAENYAREDADPEEIEKEDTRLRRELDAIVHETERVKEHHATIYLVGDENAKVHSEPPLHEARIFLSVVCGSNEQIEALKRRYEAVQ